MGCQIGEAGQAPEMARNTEIIVQQVECRLNNPHPDSRSVEILVGCMEVGAKIPSKLYENCSIAHLSFFKLFIGRLRVRLACAVYVTQK